MSLPMRNTFFLRNQGLPEDISGCWRKVVNIHRFSKIKSPSGIPVQTQI